MRINLSIIFSLALTMFLLTGCSSEQIPKAYRQKPRETITRISGSWINIRYRNTLMDSSYESIQGELIAVQADSFYILTDSLLLVVDTNSIELAKLYLFKNQTRNYLFATGFIIAPALFTAFGSEYFEEFFLLIVPMAIAGTIIGLVENHGSNYGLLYPKSNSLRQFGNYSRFPMGIPAEVNMKELQLMPDIKK